MLWGHGLYRKFDLMAVGMAVGFPREPGVIVFPGLYGESVLQEEILFMGCSSKEDLTIRATQATFPKVLLLCPGFLAMRIFT